MGDGDQGTKGAKARPTKVASHAAPVPWYRRPRNLAVLVLVAAGVVAVTMLFQGRDSSKLESSDGQHMTIPDYLAQEGIAAEPIRPGDPGTPGISFRASECVSNTCWLPPGWYDAGTDAPPGSYATAFFDNSSNPDHLANVVVLFSRLVGQPDPAKILAYAPGELQNLPGYIRLTGPTQTTLNGFEAVQLGGVYRASDGEERIIAQKTAVIPAPGNLYVLQINVDVSKGDYFHLQQVTALMDEQAKITP